MNTAFDARTLQRNTIKDYHNHEKIFNDKKNNGEDTWKKLKNICYLYAHKQIIEKHDFYKSNSLINSKNLFPGFGSGISI